MTKVYLDGIVHQVQQRGSGAWLDTDCGIVESEWLRRGYMARGNPTVTCMSCLSAPVIPAGEALHVERYEDLPVAAPRGTSYLVGVYGNRVLYVFGDRGWQLWNSG